jgi:lipopolysaccharide transport system ATP-binding protein
VVSHRTLQDDFKRLWAKVLGKPDPTAKITAENTVNYANTEKYVWALKDINFEIERGDVIGVIGKNGSGKSTLLKLLSKVTTPTKGEIKIKGRLASLLEVGTGFHGELTGRENIFLNGAILGMTKPEIRRKFDEIVEFSGIEKYLDTPVKRYSSGMYVRLAFSVAAHLDPDILIIDEVLAVGDIDFQNKCIAKMREVSSVDGRTILFVSHNMQIVKGLCNKGLFFSSGSLIDSGNIDKIIGDYYNNALSNVLEKSWATIESAVGNDLIKVRSLKATPLYENGTLLDVATPILIELDFWTLIENLNLGLKLSIFFNTGECVFQLQANSKKLSKGTHKAVANIPKNLLNDGIYTISVEFIKDLSIPIFSLEHVISFEIFDNRESLWIGKWQGAVRPTFVPFEIISQ